ncbi:hypothetical protein FY528_17745 [Hymenobacter lutimineralis]|uniref:Uncharacterized protein n=1 Tax=Hymenobacter lutimineralis TaxID=2606448 RepID=A0A5D6US53_9BACT|nr:hypothetical protein [Hymenobacter lutimineralis]TYZ06531.1 hypothetical protein FY528_17745 [Hymenobacter lutimineralis]
MSFRWLFAVLLIGTACSQDGARTPENSTAAPSSSDTLATTPSAAPPAPVAAEADEKTVKKPYDLTQPIDSAGLRACQLLPADESRQDSSLRIYLANLNRIVEARDAQGLLALVDTNTVSSYGGGEYGSRDFART